MAQRSGEFSAPTYGENSPAADTCVSLAETAAEKLVSLTRRTAAERAGVGSDPKTGPDAWSDTSLREHIDPNQVAQLARATAAMDAEEFRNQHPAYAADIPGETRETLRHCKPIRFTAAATMTSSPQWYMEKGGNSATPLTP